MKTIFDQSTRNELIARINNLDERSPAQWGKMNASQMIRHCALWEEMALGKRKYKWSLLGRIFGRMVLKTVVKNDEPLRKNTPTIPDFIIKDATGQGAADKQRWISLLKEYDQFDNHNFIHPFFGKMTLEQIGYMAYKHTDHHLRQFNG